jgi:hypothetical protein
MNAYLMTRGTPRKLDYRFLGGDPPERWWSPLKEWLDLEQPEVVVRDGARVLLSGILSTRRDAANTLIRYTLVVDGAEPDLLVRLAVAGLDDDVRATLGAALDRQFPADWVDAALKGTQSAEGDLEEKLGAVLTPGSTEAQDDDAGAADWMRAADDRRNAATSVRTPESWAGSVADGNAVAAFWRRVAKLASSRPGWAFTTAAFRGAEGARGAAAALGVQVAVLLREGDLLEIVDLGKARPGPLQSMPPRRRALRHTRPVVLIGAAVLLVLAALIVTTIAVRARSTSSRAPNAPPTTSTSTSTTPTASAASD